MNPAEDPEPTGAELAKRFRSLLPERLRSQFDEDIAGYYIEPYGVSQCGALLSLASPFIQALTAGEVESAQAILHLADQLLGYPQGRDKTGSLRNSVLTCFLEDVLPLPPDMRPVLRLGPNIRAFAEQHDPYWLTGYAK